MDDPIRANVTLRIAGRRRGRAPAIIQPGRVSLASIFQQAGYTTGVVGKWHLGLGPESGPDWNGELRPGPLEIGFDYRIPLPHVREGICGSPLISVAQRDITSTVAGSEMIRAARERRIEGLACLLDLTDPIRRPPPLRHRVGRRRTVRL